MKDKPITKPKPVGYRFGRPTLYTPELLHDCRVYLYGENYNIENNGAVSINYDENNEHNLPAWKRLRHPTPSVVGLCLFVGITSKTAYEWLKQPDKQDFCDILKTVEDWQHLELINNGTTGVFNSKITAIRLGKHGYSEKSEVVNEYTGGKQIIYIEKDQKDKMEEHISSIVDELDDADRAS